MTRHAGPASAVALSGDCVAPRNYRSAGIKCPEMIRVALTDEAYDAIASTLPKGAARWPMQRDRGQGGGGRPHEGHARARRELQQVILKLVELKTSDQNELRE